MDVIIKKDQYGRVIEATVSFKMTGEIDRYGDDMVPAEATTMSLEDAKAFIREELIDMSPNDLWEKIVNNPSITFSDDKE